MRSTPAAPRSREGRPYVPSARRRPGGPVWSPCMTDYPFALVFALTAKTPGAPGKGAARIHMREGVLRSLTVAQCTALVSALQNAAADVEALLTTPSAPVH